MKKLLSAVAGLSLLALGLTGCAPASKVVANTVLNIGQESLATSLNSGLLANESASESNEYISGLTQSAFFETDSTGQLVANDKFGYLKVVSSDPASFEVSYTVRKNVSWSDGTPIDAVDVLLSWAASVNLADAGFQSSLSGTGLAAAELPTLGVSNRRIYLKFAHPVADWQSLAKLSVPAHLLASAAFGEQADATTAKQKVAEAILSKNVDSLKKLATAYNSAFNLSSTEFDVTKYASSGAYQLVSATNSAVVLKARTDCFWCKTATVETVNLNFYSDPNSLMTAINNGEIDLAEAVDTSALPLATLVTNLDQLKDKGYKYSTLQSGQIAAIIFNYGEGSRLNETYKYISASDRENLKQALMAIVPRQRIVDSLGVPIKLVRSDSFAFLSTQSDYVASVQQNGSASYRVQDAEKVAELLKKLRLTSLNIMRVLFNSSDLNAQVAFNLMNQYAADAKLQLANASVPDVSTVIASGQYEAYITKVKVLSSNSAAIGAMQNAQSTLKSPELEKLVGDLAANSDGTTQNQSLAAIDALLFSSDYGVPLYELPKVVVFSSKLKNYAAPVGSNSAVSNFDLWTVAAEKQQ